MPRNGRESIRMIKVAEFLDRYGLHVDPQTRYIDFISEAGALGSAVLSSTDYGSRPLTSTPELRSKAGDCLFSLLALLDESDIDPDELMQDVLDRYQRRMEEYPKGE